VAKHTQWFYFRDGTAHGPFSPGEMRELARSGTLLASDLLWRPGMDRQRPAGQSTSLWADEESARGGDGVLPGRRSTWAWIGAALVGSVLVLAALLMVVALSLQHSRATAVVPPRGPAPAVAGAGAGAGRGDVATGPSAHDEAVRRPSAGVALDQREAEGEVAPAIEASATLPTPAAVPTSTPPPTRAAGDDF
jgi:hypothetical protein